VPGSRLHGSGDGHRHKQRLIADADALDAGRELGFAARTAAVRTAVLGLLAIAALVAAGVGRSAWIPTGLGNGKIGSKTMAASTGNVPSGSVSSHSVTLTWNASHFADGANVPSYVIKRYNALTNALQTTLANCNGLVGATTCTENNVPTGAWKYTVTPAAGAWRGIEGGMSATITVLI
jgi:hypothetical protein